MASQLLKDLSTNSRKWIIQTRVSRKWIATNCNTGKLLHMDLVLIDSKGSDIWAMIPPFLIPKFESTLREQEVYEIRHFKVALTKNTFRPVPNRLMLEFDSATLVQHVKSYPSIPSYKFYFLKHSDMMQRLYDKKNLSDVVGQLVQHSAVTSKISATKRWKDITLKLIEGEMVRVTLWGTIGNQVDDMVSHNEGRPVILTVTSVFVDEYKGELCLSSTGATVLKANLDIPEVQKFNLGDGRLNAPVLLAEEPAPEIQQISIAQLNEFKTMEEKIDQVFAVEGQVIQVRSNWFYMGCVGCPRKVEEDLDEYFCGHCNTTSKTAAAKYRVKLQLQDDSGDADFAILEREGLRFFGVMADVLFQGNQRNKEPIPRQIEQVVSMKLKVHVKLTQFNFINPQAEYTVACIEHDPLAQIIEESVASQTSFPANSQEISPDLVEANLEDSSASSEATEGNNFKRQKKAQVVDSDEEEK
ncbi:unnamed protein product [Linum trigynum]|uniref:Replication factor A C-terminal domain-containing protein n=1 Tax=Linum trigynum TaxID=586398 RepID=A0AAV2EPJ9_9ROSI